MLIYHSLVTSKLRYGLICWATAPKYLLNKVNVVHNKIVRYLSFSKPCSRAWPLYCSLKVLPLDILINIEWGKTAYRFQSNTLPPVFNDYFRKPTHSHNTRYASRNNFEIIRVNSGCPSNSSTDDSPTPIPLLQFLYRRFLYSNSPTPIPLPTIPLPTIPLPPIPLPRFPYPDGIVGRGIGVG